MSNLIILAQNKSSGQKTATPANKTQTQTQPSSQPQPESGGLGWVWMGTSVILLAGIIGLVIYGKKEIEKYQKKVKFEEFKNRELQKKLKLALDTITKMETNPDLVHSREFNLDYLRMRMDENLFNSGIANQIKVKIKELISVALRPNQAEAGAVGIASTSGRQVDEMFDVTYETGESGQRSKRVLFRIQIKLMKLPTQATSSTVNEIIDCLVTFLSPIHEQNDTWQPTIQGRLVQLHWDQKAKPTPLLVLEQASDGANVTIRTKRV
ncbi:MAG TPA: hypothetical protein V6C58_23865 [Allocoleopsis sp.]